MITPGSNQLEQHPAAVQVVRMAIFSSGLGGPALGYLRREAQCPIRVLLRQPELVCSWSQHAVVRQSRCIYTFTTSSKWNICHSVGSPPTSKESSHDSVAVSKAMDGDQPLEATPDALQLDFEYTTVAFKVSEKKAKQSKPGAAKRKLRNKKLDLSSHKGYRAFEVLSGNAGALFLEDNYLAESRTQQQQQQQEEDQATNEQHAAHAAVTMDGNASSVHDNGTGLVLQSEAEEQQHTALHASVAKIGTVSRARHISMQQLQQQQQHHHHKNHQQHQDQNQNQLKQQRRQWQHQQTTEEEQLAMASRVTGMLIKQLVKLPRFKTVLLRLDATSIQSRLRSLQSVLQLPNKRSAVAVASEHPALLQRSEASILACMQQLTLLLQQQGLPDPAVTAVELARQAPELLSVHGSNYAAALYALSSCISTFGSPAQVQHPAAADVAGICLGGPNSTQLDGARPSVTPATASSAAATAAAVVATASAVQPPPPAAATAAILAQALAMVRVHPVLLARRHPHCSRAGFAGVLRSLRDLLDVSDKEVLELACQEPAVLMVGTAPLQMNISTLLQTFRIKPNAALQMVQHVPDLLMESPGVLKATCRRFHGLMMCSKAWRRQLPKLQSHPRNLAVAISFDSSRYDRMQYLVQTHRDRGITFKEALTMSDEDFEEMYTGYKAWWAERGR